MTERIDIETVKRLGGGYAAIAKKLNLARATVWGWDRVPPKHVVAIERITGIPRTQLCPELYAPSVELPGTPDASQDTAA